MKKPQQNIPTGTIVRLYSDRYSNYKIIGFSELTAKYQLSGPYGSKLELYEDDFKVYFTLQDGLDIQAKHLAEWKLRLNPECYNLLKIAAIASNKDVTDGFEVKRGESLSTFVANWRPGRKLSEIYF